MKYFSIFDLQRDAIANIRRDYWNAVMIGAIVYGVSVALGMATGLLMMPLQIFSGMLTGLSFASLANNIGSPLFFANLGAVLLPYTLMSLLSWAAAIAIEPVNAGARLAYLAISAGARADANAMFQTFKRFWRFVGAILWYSLFVLLWSLLFLIPGIIKSYAYFMMPYLVAEYPNLPVQEAMKLSMRITMGYKHKIFFMYLLLFAWGLLVIPAMVITCGLGGIAFSLLWFAPLSGLLNAAMYNKLKMLAFEDGRITAKDLYITPKKKADENRIL